MIVPENIWTDHSLDTLDKLILGILLGGGETRTVEDIAKELQTTQKRVKQKINRMAKEGRLVIITTKGQTRMEVHNGI